MNKDNIWKKIFITSLGSGASQVINFLFGIVLVRILSVSEYAVYKQGNLILMLSMSFFFIISPISLGYFMGKSKDMIQKKTYLFQTILSLLLVSFIGACLLYMFRTNIAIAYSNPMLSQYFGYFCMIIFFETGCSYYTYYMVADSKNKKLAYVTFYTSLLRVLALGISLIFKNQLFSSFMFFYLLSVGMKFLYMLYDTYRDYRFVAFIFSWKIIKNQIIFSVPIMIMGIITALNNNMDKNIVSFLYEPERYALYVNGAFEIPFISIISTSIITVMLPEISAKFDSNDKCALDEIIATFRRIIFISCCIIIPLIFSILSFSKDIIIILFSAKYIGCMSLFQIYLFMLLFKALNLSVLITAANKQYYLVRNGIVMILSNMIFLLVIKELLGFDYLTLAPLLASLIMNILMVVDIKKIYKAQSIKAIIPMHEIFLCLFACTLLFLLSRFVLNNVNSNIFITITTGPILYIIMFLSCFSTNKKLANQFLKKIKIKIKGRI